MTKLKYFLSFFILLFLILVFCRIAFEKNSSKAVEINFWTVQLSPFSQYFNSIIDEFEKVNPDIKVKWIDIPYSEAEKRVLASLLSNRMPDVINITSDFNITLATKGALYSIKMDLNEYNPALLKTLEFNGNVWGVPFYATSAITIYNKQLVSEFGIDSQPKSYAELFELMEKSPKINNKYLFMPTLTENDTAYKILNKYGLISGNSLLSKQSIEFFDIIKNLYKDEKFPTESISQTHREVLEKYSAGQIAYLQAGANFLNIIKENSLDVYTKSGVLPQFYGKEKKYDFSLMTLAIPLKSKNKNEAVKFIKFLTNNENQLEFSRITGVLPCNKHALADNYFKIYDESDLQSKSRVLGAIQLSAPIEYPIQTIHHKKFIKLLNKTVEKILLEKTDTKELLEKLRLDFDSLKNN